MIHAARMENSPRLRRTLQVLSDCEWHSTLNLIQNAAICAVNSAISELRAPVNGYQIECKRVSKSVWEYRLREPARREPISSIGNWDAPSNLPLL